MTWWLSATGEELRQAQTCRMCGCDGADIDLNLCQDCFLGLPESEQWRRNMAIARGYNLPDRAAIYEARMNEALKRETGSQS